MKKLLLVFLVLAGLSAWIWIYFLTSFKEPVFVGMKDIHVVRSEGTLAEVLAVAVFNNPNTISATLINTELRVYSNDVLVGQVSQTHVSEIPGQKDFEVPLKFTTDLLKLGMSQSISGLLEKVISEERMVPLRFDGYCRIKSGGETYKIPISYEDKLMFR